MKEIKQLISEDKFAEAKLLLAERLLKEPNDIEALKLHGRCNINLDLFEDGKKDFETVVKYKAADAESWFYLAGCYDSLDDFIRAEAAYKTVIGLKEDYIEAYKSLCVLYVRNGDAKKAVELGKSALKYNKENDYTLDYIIGTACMSLKDFIGSVFHLGKAMEANPKHAQIYNNLGTCYVSTGELDLAREAYRKASELEPENSLTLFNIASIFQVQEKHKEACEFFQKAYTLEQDDTYLAAMALSETKTGDYSAAIAHYKLLVERNPEKVNYRYNLACCYEAKGDYNYAEGILSDLVLLNPKSVAMAQKLAKIYMKLERPLNAKELYEKIITQGSASSEIYYEFANVCAKIDDLDKAEKNLRKVISLDVDFAPAHKDLGVIYLKRRQFDWARDEFAKALGLAPNDTGILFEYANFLHATADFAVADEVYEKALELDPENADILAFSALNKIHTKDFDAALVQIGRAIEKLPGEGFLYFIAGKLKFLKNAFEDAKYYLIRAFELSPSNDVQNLLGLCYYELGDYAQANGVFKNLLASSPVNVNMMIHIAKCYEKLGDAEAALAQLDEAVEIFPECEEIHEIIRRLS